MTAWPTVKEPSFMTVMPMQVWLLCEMRGGGCSLPISELVGARLWDRHDSAVPREVVVGGREGAAQCQSPAGDIAWTF